MTLLQEIQYKWTMQLKELTALRLGTCDFELKNYYSIQEARIDEILLDLKRLESGV